MTDIADEGSYQESLALKVALAKHAQRQQLPEEYNEKGEKICINCGVDIPTKRAAISGVVRCIDCQRIEERL